MCGVHLYIIKSPPTPKINENHAIGGKAWSYLRTEIIIMSSRLPVLWIEFILPGKVSFVGDTVIPNNKGIGDSLVHL